MTDGPTDPRLRSEFVHRPGRGEVVLVGVVHDHPASVHRVARVVADVDPTVLAVELPPLAVPLYRAYARSDRTPPALGGEMSAAIQAAATDRVVGIDGPSLRFLSRLSLSLLRRRPSSEGVGRVLAATLSTAVNALRCRAAATLARRTGLRVQVDDPVDHDCSLTDPPEAQAADERAHVERAESVLHALTPGPGTERRKRVREAHMADRVRSLWDSTEGAVVAVVGVGHLDELADGLAPGTDPR